MKKTGITTALICSLALGASAQSPYTLDQCLQMARENNRTIQNYALELQSSDEQKKEAYTKYFPQISANVTAFYAFDKIIKGDFTIPQELSMLGQPFATFAGMPVSYGVLNKGYGATISAVEPIYAGGQIHNGNKLAAVGKEAARLKLSIKEKDVLQAVTENYWQIATIRYNLRTIAAAEKQMDAVMQHVQNCVYAGVTTRNALLQVRLRKQELASNRLKLENGEHILLMLLAQQIGAPIPPKGESFNSTEDSKTNSLESSDASKYSASSAQQSAAVGSVSSAQQSAAVGSVSSNSVAGQFDIYVPDEAAPSSLPIQADVLTAVNNRDELPLKTKAVEAQQLMVKMERGKNLPTVALGVMGYNLGMGGMGSMSIKLINDNMTNGLALATVSIPISSWWGGTHAVRHQKFLLKEAENNLADAREQLAIDIESAWSNLTEAYKQIDIAKASVTESEENLRMYTDQYKAGTVTITDLLDAETLNRKSHDQLSSAIATYNVRLADYRRKTE